MQKTKKQILGFSSLMLVAATTFVAHSLPPAYVYANGGSQSNLQVEVTTNNTKSKIKQPQNQSILRQRKIDFEIQHFNVKKARYRLMSAGVQIPISHSEFIPQSNPDTDRFTIENLEYGKEYILVVDSENESGVHVEDSVKVNLRAPSSGGSSSSGGSQGDDNQDDPGGSNNSNDGISKPYDPNDPANPNPSDPYNPYNPFDPNDNSSPLNPKNPDSLINPSNPKSPYNPSYPNPGSNPFRPGNPNSATDVSITRVQKGSNNPIMEVKYRKNVCLIKVQAFYMPGMEPLFKLPVVYKVRDSKKTEAKFPLDFASHGAKKGVYRIVAASFLTDKDGKCTIYDPVPTIVDIDYQGNRIGVPNTGFLSFVSNQVSKSDFVATGIAIFSVIAGFAIFLLGRRSKKARR